MRMEGTKGIKVTLMSAGTELTVDTGVNDVDDFLRLLVGVVDALSYLPGDDNDDEETPPEDPDDKGPSDKWNSIIREVTS